MAQVLEIPPDGHIPPGFFGYVADRTTLVVLDNLEQVPDADEVVDVLLREAQHLTDRGDLQTAHARRGRGRVRRVALSVPAVGSSVEEIGQAAAVQLFVEHASRVRKGFKLTADNAVDVARLCESLDGLPLAIELAAARAKLLTPKAILRGSTRAWTSRAPSAAGTSGSARSGPRSPGATTSSSPPSRSCSTGWHLRVGASFEAIEAVVPPEALPVPMWRTSCSSSSTPP